MNISKSKIRHRSRNGCTQCRSVSRKCDEIKPQCGRCLRLHFDCKYTSRFVWKDETNKHINNNNSIGQSITRKSTSPSESIEKYQTSTSPTNSIINNSEIPDDDQLLQQCKFINHFLYSKLILL